MINILYSVIKILKSAVFKSQETILTTTHFVPNHCYFFYTYNYVINVCYVTKLMLQICCCLVSVLLTLN